MPITYKQVSAFSVMGIEGRTTNAKEASGNGIIGKQWQRFFQEGVLDKIPHKTNANIYALYTDYAGDHNGEYTYIIGAMVAEDAVPPSGMTLRKVPAGQYSVLTSKKGPFSKVVPAIWSKVWALESDRTIARAYKTDFEVYDDRARDPQNGVIDLYIGTK